MLGKLAGHLKDCLYRCIVPNFGIDHQVEAMPLRPYDIEISFYEVGAILVHCLHKFDRFLLALAHCQQPADLVLKGSVNKDMKGVFPFCKIVGGASADD